MSLRPLRLLPFLCAILTALLLSGSFAPEALAQDPAPAAQETTTVPLSGQQPEAAEQEAVGVQERIDNAMGRVNGWFSAVFFFDLIFWDNTDQSPGLVLPLAVFWLVLGAIVFTFRMGFINFRGFGHAIAVTRGKYDDPKDAGEVSHFQALATALSATVGLGNIAGVAIAVSIGGPGATFWMIIAGLLGMTSKFTECTLGQQYRQVRSDGRSWAARCTTCRTGSPR